jgi:Pyruvate/2-oxoacid:ferredoxin oxidoreductase gamma subunit
MNGGSKQVGHPLQRHDGVAMMSACEAVLKGVLEQKVAVSRFIMTESRASRRLQEALRLPEIRDLLRRHRLVDRVVDDAGRALEMARWDTREGRHVVAMGTGPTVTSAVRELERSGNRPFQNAEAVAVVLEDLGTRPGLRQRLAAAGLPILEATSVTHIRDSIEHALRLSRAACVPAVMLVDREILQSMASIQILPNRVGDGPPAGPPRQRGLRWDEVGGPLRIARRLELNSVRAMPSPGERSAIGFIVAGPAERSMRRIEVILGVEGRVPTLHLAVSNPLDHTAIERVLLRCETVVVLEPTGQRIELAVSGIAQRLILDGQSPAAVWGHELPDGNSPDRLIHPSPLARVLAPLIQRVMTGPPLTGRLSEPLPPYSSPQPKASFGDRGQAEDLRQTLHAAVLESIEPEDDRVESEHDDPLQWIFDGERIGPAEGRRVVAEVWRGTEFRRSGAAAIRQASADGGAWLIVIAAGPSPAGADIERLVRAVTPPDRSEGVRLQRPANAGPAEVTRHVHAAAAGTGLTVLIVEDGPPARFDVATLERGVEEIDRVGYQAGHRLVWPADRACVIRQPPRLRLRDQREVHEAVSSRATIAVETIPLRWPPHMGGRIRPLVELIGVHRIQAPTRGTGVDESPGQPEFQHADQPVWYAHLAGLRGMTPGVVGRVLQEAAVVMGYHVEVRADPTSIGPGRRSFAQIAFSRPRDDAEEAAVPPVIPWGEAGLLLGYDRGATIDAVDPELPLRVVSRGRTFVFANTGVFEDEIERVEDPEDEGEAIGAHLLQVGGESHVVTADISGICRYRFHNERLADMVLLGLAWQSGAVPLSLDAMHQGLQRIESAGVARLSEAFEYGRAALLDPERLLRPQERPIEPSDRSVRRYRLMLAKMKMSGPDRADRFRRLVKRALGDVPGLLETGPGREAHRDFIVALRRCVTWGGFDLAERFADRIIALYKADRADTGRALTRAAVLPLAESLLIRDPIYVASMAIGSEHRRQTRQRLNVRRARSDVLSIRYLTRIECTMVRWRVRVDLRTSDWVAHALAAMRWVLPHRLRGKRSQRLVRDQVQEVVMQAASADEDQYEQWRAVLEWLHTIALDGRLRRISPAAFRREIRKLREP